MTNSPKVILKRERHRDTDVLSIYSPNKEPFNTVIRKIGCTYSSTKRMWWLPWSKEVTNKAYRAFKDVAWVDYSALKVEKGKSEIQEVEKQIEIKVKKKGKPYAGIVWTKEQKEAMWAFAQKLEIRDYSESTFKTYGVYFKQFLAAHPTANPPDITEEEIIAHVVRVVKQHNYANKTQNQIVTLNSITRKYWA